MFRRHDYGSSDQLHSWESSTPEAMDSDNEYTVATGRRMTKKMRQMLSEQISSNPSEQQCFLVSDVPLTASHNLKSLSRQFLTEYFKIVAPGQVNEIHINSDKNILTVDAISSTIIEKLKTIPTLGLIPVRSFINYGKESTTGVISHVDFDIKNVDLRNLLSSSAWESAGDGDPLRQTQTYLSAYRTSSDRRPQLPMHIVLPVRLGTMRLREMQEVAWYIQDGDAGKSNFLTGEKSPVSGILSWSLSHPKIAKANIAWPR
ncbi:hypothetical protein HPB49_016778 [Dermacentor silvarum]|uniref:Uncharacterized protein n=1 Tax=Dermacentor silvarum TaxID=543639 RepID=A0ACB8D6R8_DERSI|nr:hypothetical protein HPB49_016778 [Dermacentor silvarum]